MTKNCNEEIWRNELSTNDFVSRGQPHGFTYAVNISKEFQENPYCKN